VLSHQSSSDNTVFLLFLAILSFLLAYISVWLVLHTRRPWLAALANGVVLLINLNWATDDKTVIYLVVFLLATLLLLVRFSLAENIRVWRARGLRFSPDLGWDFMQAGAIFAVIVMLLAYLLPAGPPNAAIISYWNSANNPWQRLQSAWQSLFSGAHGDKGPGTGFSFFGPSLTLTGSVKLPNSIVLHYKALGANPDPAQYLLTETLDTYNGQNTWSQTPPQAVNYPAGQTIPPSGPVNAYSSVQYDIVYDQVPDATRIFVPGVEARSFNIPAQVAISEGTQQSVAYAALSSLATGAEYQAEGYVSDATAQQLRAVSFPKDLSPQAQAQAYPKALLNEYLPENSPISPRVAQAALDATNGTNNMYDAAVALENFLRTYTYSLTNPDPPAGQDAVEFFLFQSKTGFCSYFASAMALMGRALGMPTRLALGFTDGTFDAHSQAYQVRGTAAHVWPQVYFAGWGWINFEPTSSFSKFLRPVENTPGQVTPTPKGGNASTPSPHATKDTNPNGPDLGGGGTPTGPSSALVDAGLGLSLALALLLLAAALFTLWWRLLFRGLSPVSAAFARVARLGAWAGAPPGRAQTPAEYGEELGNVIPAERSSLRDLSTLYAQERWGGGLAPEGNGRLPQLYEQVRAPLTAIIVRRLRRSPGSALRGLRRRRARG
jgi:transglutaminase-like putative cysteine protease